MATVLVSIGDSSIRCVKAFVAFRGYACGKAMDKCAVTRTCSLHSHEPQRDVFGIGGRHEPEFVTLVIYCFCLLDVAGLRVKPLGFVGAGSDSQPEMHLRAALQVNRVGSAWLDKRTGGRAPCDTQFDARDGILQPVAFEN